MIPQTGQNSFSEKLFKKIVELRSHLNLGARWTTYVHAVAAGILAAFVAVAFQKSTHFILETFTGVDRARVVQTFIETAPWRRIFSLCLGGVLAGCVLLFASKKVKKRATPYMEAVAIGNGYIPVIPNLLRSLAAIITIGCGASIGREGPLVQTATVFASLIGRKTRMSKTRLRLLIACSAAGAMSAVFHTPLAGGLFVCEIVIGALSIDLLAPLLAASCASYLTISVIGDPSPLYEVADAYLKPGFDVAVYAVVMGVFGSLFAKLWLLVLSKSRKLLNGNQYWLPVRLALAGCIVGTLTIFFPEVAGNGAHMIKGVVSMNFDFQQVCAFMGLKFFAVVTFFALGAVGGVLTPSLTMGCLSGFVFAQILVLCGVQLTPQEMIGFALLGMASFFTTAAAAPITSLFLVVEFTMTGRMIFPLIIGVLVSYAVSKIFDTKSMYNDEASGTMLSTFRKPMGAITIRDIFRKTSEPVAANAFFYDIAKRFLLSPEEAVFVVSRSNKYIGAIFRTDILHFLNSPDVSFNVIADDIMRCDVPTVSPDMKLIDAVKIFSENESFDLLPIVGKDAKFGGVVNRSDILMGLNELIAREKIK